MRQNIQGRGVSGLAAGLEEVAFALADALGGGVVDGLATTLGGGAKFLAFHGLNDSVEEKSLIDFEIIAIVSRGGARGSGESAWRGMGG